MSVHQFPSSGMVGGGFNEAGGGGGDGGNIDQMEARLAKLEGLAEKTGDRLTNIERDLAVLKATSATKEDLHREMHSTTWKLVGAIVLAQLLPALPSMLRAFKLIA